jgi:hypothetical protein
MGQPHRVEDWLPQGLVLKTGNEESKAGEGRPFLSPPPPPLGICTLTEAWRKEAILGNGEISGETDTPARQVGTAPQRLHLDFIFLDKREAFKQGV